MPIPESKQKVIHAIVNQELEFFRDMKTEEPVPENTLPALRRMRWMTYSVLSEDTLSLLLRDLKEAKENGRNTMIEKYALMEGLIPDIQDNPIIRKIALQETKWQEEIAIRYSKALRNHDANRPLFQHYMECEMQSWSPEALLSYYSDILTALEEGVNLAEKRYDNLYASLGKGSLKEVDDSMSDT